MKKTPIIAFVISASVITTATLTWNKTASDPIKPTEIDVLPIANSNNPSAIVESNSNPPAAAPASKQTAVTQPKKPTHNNIDKARDKVPSNFWQSSPESQDFWQNRITKGHNDKVESAFIELDGKWLSNLEIGEEFPVKLPFSQNEYTAVVTDKKTYLNGAVSIRSKYRELTEGFNVRLTLENGNGFGHFSTPEGIMNVEINSGFARVTAQRHLDNAFPEAIIEVDSITKDSNQQENVDSLNELN